MKFVLLFITVTFAFLSSNIYALDVSSSLNTNAKRLALGLPPLAPRRRATPVYAAKRSDPSSNPNIENSCNTGTIQCCNSVTYANTRMASLLTGLLDIVVPANTAVGITCHPLSIVGIGGNHCSQQPVCCQDNQMHGLVVIGCSPININA